MVQYNKTTNYTYSFTGLESGDEVKYYISAANTAGYESTDPTCGRLDPHQFVIE